MVIDPAAVARRAADLERQIASIERPFDHPVRILAVTKGFDGSAIRAAAACGLRSVGENYAQDLLTKTDVIDELGVDVHFIGRLQSNKVRQIASWVTVWETVDRASIITEIGKRAPGARVLIQVNATGEDGKGGCRLDEVAGLLQRGTDAGLHVEGLMTVGPTDRPAEDARAPFTAVRALVDLHRLPTCSMGMSGDVAVAVECGSTEVRLGAALFGPRPPVG